jgi:tryptophan-rich sensory protein
MSTTDQSNELPQMGSSQMAPPSTPSKMDMHMHKDKHMPVGDMREQASDKMLWGFIIVGILILVVIYLIIRPCREWYGSQLHKPFDEHGEVMFVLLCIVVLLLCYGMYRAYHCSGRGGYWTNMCGASFVVTMILLVIWAYVLFRHRHLEHAFYWTIAILASTIWMMWTFWKSGDRVAFYMSIPWLLYSIALCWQGWCISKHAGNRIDESSPSRSGSRSRSPSRERLGSSRRESQSSDESGSGHESTS